MTTPLSLYDAITTLRLAQSGLSPLPATSNDVGVNGADPYAPSSSTLTTLSGDGQLLSAADQFSSALTNGSTSTSTTVTSSSPSVATATASTPVSDQIYALNVQQVATGQQDTSSYFSDPNAVLGSAGSFTVQSGSLDSHGVFQADNTSPTTVNVATPTLNGLAAAINASGAPLTASVQSNGYGSYLQLTSTTTGAADGAFQLTSTNNGPLDNFQPTLNALGFTTTQAAQDSRYTVNGGTVQTSSTPTLSVDAGVNATALTTGTTTLVAGNPLNVAQNLVSSYNALQGNLGQLTSANGALNAAPTVANNLVSSLSNQAQSTVSNGSSSLTTLAQLGITAVSPGQASSPLSLNTSTFQSAFASDSLGALSLLSTSLNAFAGIANNVASSSNTNASTGALGQAQSVIDQYSSSLAGANPGLAAFPTGFLDSLVQNEIVQGAQNLGLTNVVNLFA